MFRIFIKNYHNQPNTNTLQEIFDIQNDKIFHQMVTNHVQEVFLNIASQNIKNNNKYSPQDV